MLHGEFEVSIGLGASPADVWAAFSDPGIRERWASIPGKESSFELDFRPGGHEIARAVTLDTGDTGTTLTHHKQYAFLAWTGDGSDDRAHLRGATQLSLNRLASVVESRWPSETVAQKHNG
jgi:hypothetical protein